MAGNLAKDVAWITSKARVEFNLCVVSAVHGQSNASIRIRIWITLSKKSCLLKVYNSYRNSQ